MPSLDVVRLYIVHLLRCRKCRAYTLLTYSKGKTHDKCAICGSDAALTRVMRFKSSIPLNGAATNLLAGNMVAYRKCAGYQTPITNKRGKPVTPAAEIMLGAERSR